MPHTEHRQYPYPSGQMPPTIGTYFEQALEPIDTDVQALIERCDALAKRNEELLAEMDRRRGYFGTFIQVFPSATGALSRNFGPFDCNVALYLYNGDPHANGSCSITSHNTTIIPAGKVQSIIYRWAGGGAGQTRVSWIAVPVR